MYALTKTQLLRDLHRAYLDARRHKRKRAYLKEFERNLERNLCDLCDALWTRTYTPKPAVCFPISDPTKREIIAAQFVDCIVNHLYFNYTHELYERTFIHDSYSSIKGRGTHRGVSRAEHHMRSASQNYTRPCYVLQKDIRGFFIHINRRLVLRFAMESLAKMSSHRVKGKGSPVWEDVIDMEFVKYLTESICLHDPVKDCIVLGSGRQWEGLAASKSMRCGPHATHGLALGNLNSQLLCNVLMNVFDQYVKRTLKCKHYGRSTDDFYIIDTSPKRLRRINRRVTAFLRNVLDLETNEGKTRLRDVRRGFKYLGAFIKPYRTYISAQTLRRLRVKLQERIRSGLSEERLRSSLNSFLGLLRHYRTFHIRLRLVVPLLQQGTLHGTFNDDYTVYCPG